MTPELATIIAAVVGVAVVIWLALAWWINRAPNIERSDAGDLPLFGSDIAPPGQPWAGEPRGTSGLQPIARPTSSTPSSTHATEPPGAAGSAHVSRTSTPAGMADVRTGTSQPPLPSVQDWAAPEQAVEAARAATASPTVSTFTTSARKPPIEGPDRFAPPPPAETPTVSESSPVVGNGVPGVMVEGHLLRFSVPAEGTLQFLPGRLEIATGLDSGREFRFVRVPGPNGTEVTFGRSEGELYRHIQLRNQTVSRSHARMRLDNGNWLLLNLSNTNPVVHNGRILGNAEEQPLADGDRIEMGEVLFTFRSR